MSEVTIRAESVVKLTDGLMDATWTFKAGTPRDIVLRDLTGGHYQKLIKEKEQLQATNKELLEAGKRVLKKLESEYEHVNMLDQIELEKAITNAKQREK